MKIDWTKVGLAAGAVGLFVWMAKAGKPKEVNGLAGVKSLTISDIKRLSHEHSPYFFDRKTMKFFGQRMSDFKVQKLSNGKYRIYAKRGKGGGITERIFNPLTNELEHV
jgi:hypothetical protein